MIIYLTFSVNLKIFIILYRSEKTFTLKQGSCYSFDNQNVFISVSGFKLLKISNHFYFYNVTVYFSIFI